MTEKHALVGFDGFIDTVVRAVDYCYGSEKIYIDSIQNFGERIKKVAGKSTNIELDVLMKKIGGNGPIMCEAMRVLGIGTTYIGTIGDINDSIFSKFSENNNAISIGEPGETRAVEFDDGKILLGEMNDVQKLNSKQLLQHIDKQRIMNIANSCDLLCFVNWTMIIHMNEIFNFFLNEIIKGSEQTFFFDLADPAKRTVDDILQACSYIGKFNKRGFSILGLNLNEASRILSALNIEIILQENEKEMLEAAKIISEKIHADTVFIHANTLAVGHNGYSAAVSGYFSEYPKISTGAGDHFNAGFLTKYIEDHDLESALHCGSATAKFYVDNAFSPNRKQLEKLVKI